MEAESPCPRSVLLITDRYPPHVGGLARASARLAAHASAAGIRTEVLVLRGEGASGASRSRREGNVLVHRLGQSRSPVELGETTALVLDWLHHRTGYELFHGQYAGTGGFFAVHTARLFGAASYVSLRGNDLERDVYDPSRFAQVEWTLRHAGAIGGVSRSLVRQAEALTGRRDIRFTPNSVDTDLFRPRDGDLLQPVPSPENAQGGQPEEAADSAAIHPALPGRPRLGFIGELRGKKGAAYLLDAFRAVAGHTEASLVLVGAIRPEIQPLLTELREDEPALDARIRHVPYVHDPAALCMLYCELDLVLSPSLREGMPNSVLEALACARPVLASDAGALPDLIRQGETGWILSRHELHRLGEAAREILELPVAARSAVGVRGRDWVRTHFSPERERRELLDGYALALARST